MERPLITAVTHSRDEARLTLLGVPDHPGVAGRIFTALAEANINVDMIIQNEPDVRGRRGRTCRSRSRARTCARPARRSSRSRPRSASATIRDDPEMGKVSVVGAGMKSHPGVAARVFSTLGDQGINIEMISTSPIKISCVVTADAVDRAVRALHEAFELGADQIEVEHPFGAPSMSQYRVAVVGATGAVGTVMRAKLQGARLPGERDRPVRVRALRGQGARRRARAACSPTSTIQGFDLALFSAGATTSRAWAQKFVDAGAVVVDNSSRVPPRPRDPARGLRGQPGRARGPPRPDREPELLDDAADGRAEADLRRGRHRPPDRLHLPVGLRHRREGRRASSRTRRAPRWTATPLPDADDLPAPHRVQRARRRRQLRRRRRPHRRRAQDDVRDAQDPRRREHQDRGHVRARAGAQLALGVGERWRPATT